MAKCGVCGTEFPTCYMDTVSTCPKCNTTFWNDSPHYLSNNANTTKSDNRKNKKDLKKK